MMGNLADSLLQDNSGTIERDEFLSLPQISSNPLATRFVRSYLLLPLGDFIHRLAPHVGI